LGVKERQERDRETVARAILDAARDLFVTHGYQQVSIRKIAEKIEYSPAAIYSYFPSKDDIFFALAEEGFQLLFAYAEVPEISPDEAPADRLHRQFWRYYEFSKENPEYFALMFLDRTVPRISQNWERFGLVAEKKHDLIIGIQHAIDAGAFPPGTSAYAVFHIVLAAIHGVAAQRLCDRLPPGTDADLLANATLTTIIAGLKAGAARDFVLPTCFEPFSEDQQS
jgi:AcrR family transcriptional regulator